MKPVTDKAYQLFHEGSIALSQIEANGLRIDVDYLNKAISKTKDKIKKITMRMREDKIFKKKWRKHFGQKTNMGSREQLGKVLFTIMKYPCPSHTDTGRPKVDKEALSSVDLDFVRDFIKLEKLKKVKSTYLDGILRETVDGILHPFFNLNIARTYRGSSDHPNFQNNPIKDPAMKKLVRTAFIARPNHQIVEVDYGGVEICNAACYHKDPRMIAYIKDDTKDLHRDMGAQCYMLPRKQVTWGIRDCGKNRFIFPQFYGDYYIHCAENLWKGIREMNLKTTDGLSVRKHLKRKGIIRLGDCNPEESPVEGTFEYHIREVEDDFWNNRFSVYRDWKKKWYEEYLKKGYFITLTGFKIEGVYNRKEVINYPIQGSAFHWLLWSIIRINKLLKKYRMRSLLTGQIHDSLIADVYKKELQNYLSIVHQVMTIDVRKHWRWIIVPLTVEAEASPVGGSWYDKKEIKIIAA